MEPTVVISNGLVFIKDRNSNTKKLNTPNKTHDPMKRSLMFYCNENDTIMSREIIHRILPFGNDTTNFTNMFYVCL